MPLTYPGAVTRTNEIPITLGHNGKYFTDCRPADPYEEEIMCWATSKVEADRLWSLSESMVGQTFAYEH